MMQWVISKLVFSVGVYCTKIMYTKLNCYTEISYGTAAVRQCW
jgi:hypothetical protein